eukprot:885028_1
MVVVASSFLVTVATSFKKSKPRNAKWKNFEKESAAVLPYTVMDKENGSGKEVRILMIMEDRGTGKTVLNYICGKRRPFDEDPAHTAARKFYYETGSVLTKSEYHAALCDFRKSNTVGVWLRMSKCCMFTREMTGDLSNIAERFDKRESENPGSDGTTEELHWVTVIALNDAASKHAKFVKTVSGVRVPLSKMVTHNQLDGELSKLLKSFAQKSNKNERKQMNLC